MTIDEAIKHAEEVMMENLEKTKDRNASDPIAISCFECADEHRQLAEWLKDYKRLKEQELCGDAISRQEVLDGLASIAKAKAKSDAQKSLMGRVMFFTEHLPPVTPQPEGGRWIYDKNIDNWRCSECGETPKTMGYCGSVAFMAEHFKYCNHCGCKMQGVEE